MANIKSAKKRARQSEKRRMNNQWQKTRMRTHLKKVIASIEGGDKTVAQTDYREATSVLDRLVSKGIIHKNKAARHKSRLSAKIKAMA